MGYEVGEIYKFGYINNKVWDGSTIMYLGYTGNGNVVVLDNPSGYYKPGKIVSVALGDSPKASEKVKNPFKTNPKANTLVVGTVFTEDMEEYEKNMFRMWVKVRNDAWHGYTNNSYHSIATDAQMDNMFKNHPGKIDPPSVD